MKPKTHTILRDLGSVGRKTRALRNQPISDGGNMPPFVTQPRPGND